jgi:DNA-binding NtrC family response regulator
VNCGAIPEALIESELFGHERGSFTGADKMHRGFFERADGGTLFLDEITEMPVRLQVKLLRVIETRHVQRIGSMEQLPIDVRVLAATNRRPKEAIREGSLREDLYFRLAVFPIRLPTLRERRGDVALLAEHFLGLLNDAHDTKKAWSSGALAELETREWPGNVRELKNAVYRAFILADDLLVAESAIVDVPNEATPATPVRAGATIAETERALILATLEHTNGNKPAAAKLLGVSLKTLYTRLSAYNATKP